MVEAIVSPYHAAMTAKAAEARRAQPQRSDGIATPSKAMATATVHGGAGARYVVWILAKKFPRSMYTVNAVAAHWTAKPKRVIRPLPASEWR